MKRTLSAFVTMSACLLLAAEAYGHCEIPCGIYGDELRIKLLSEHVTTIEKSMKQISELSKQKSPNHNQIVRWVVNKEKHAEELQQIVSQYFLHQRIRPVDPKKDQKGYDAYVNQLVLLHKMLIYAMKAKQSVDLEHIATLRSLLQAFERAYFKK